MEQNNRNKRFIRFIFRPAQGFFKTLSIEPARSQALYQLRLAQVKNSPRANVFPAGDANLMQVMYLSIERSPQDTRDGMICTVPRPHLLGRVLRPRVDLAWPLRRIDFRPFWILSFEFVSLLDSFLQLGKLHWFLYLLLSYFYDPSLFIFRWSSIFVEKVVLER